jgi:hypothetical protein
VNKDLEKMTSLIREILLYQYKMSPNAHHYLRKEGAVHVDPFDRMMQEAAPDSIGAICNIYEMFRSMLSLLPAGIVLIHSVFSAFLSCAPCLLGSCTRLGVRLLVRVR